MCNIHWKFDYVNDDIGFVFWEHRFEKSWRRDKRKSGGIVAHDLVHVFGQLCSVLWCSDLCD